jgi:hypothetical protein
MGNNFYTFSYNNMEMLPKTCSKFKRTNEDIPSQATVSNDNLLLAHSHVQSHAAQRFWSTTDRIYDGGPVRL